MTGLLAHPLVAAAPAVITHTRVGESAVFWIVSVIAIGSALGMILSRNAVHAALLLVIDFFCIAVFYAMQDAPFLAFVQIIVYAGAIMILFLFILMLVGVDSSDSLVETIKGQRIASLVLGIGFAALMGGAIGNAIAHTGAVGLKQANSGGNVQNIARLMFTTYLVPFETTSALLIVAAVGAMVLGHRERLVPRATQPQLMRRRLHGPHPAGLTGPGAFAEDDGNDREALLPSGVGARDSVYGEYGGTGSGDEGLRPIDPEEGGTP